MSWLFSSGHAVDIVLVVMLVEFVALMVRGQDVVTVALMLTPGALMLLALRAALVGHDWYWVALPLTVSLPLHLADMRHRRLL